MNKDLIKDLENYIHTTEVGNLNCNIDDFVEDLNFISLSEEDPVVFIYGTTPFDTFKKVIDTTKKPKRFIVLGSSIGWQNFYWNELFPDTVTFGYDIHKPRYQFSRKMIEKYNIENTYFVNDDLLLADIEDGDLIWENNLCMDEHTIDEFNLRVLSRYKDIQIVSYRPILSSRKYSNDLILINEKNELIGLKQRVIELPVSWSDKQEFYII